jgi:class 3 adenylate cyclase/pimeloyl-ACP methyl ester carboxylesterase
MEIPQTHYAESGDLLIAYQVFGSGPDDVLLNGGPASNVETVWSLPEAVQLFERLGRFARVIIFDRRDTGISDPFRDDLTLEAHVADALAVMDAVGTDRPVLVGSTEGARSMAALAAMHPGRAAGLIALAPTVRGSASESPDIAERLVDDIARQDWPDRIVGFYAPEWSEDPVRRDRISRYIRTIATPRQARRLLALSLSSDISEVLPLVQARTLVVWPRDCLLPEEGAREFAEMIPGAAYRKVPGAAVFTYAFEIEILADLIEEFVTGTAPSPPTNRVLATVLFTDLVGSTERAAELGDASWSGLLERHHAASREAVESHGGQMVKTLGDGVLATFTGPAQAVRCAQQIIAAARSEDLELRSGVHTGEVEVGPDDISGLAVHLAARIMGLAGAGEILVSRTVRDLVVGSELRFADYGKHDLEGIEEPWHLYALE